MSSEAVVTIGDLVLYGMTSADSTLEINAPEHEAEEGYDYSSMVGPEAKTASLTGTVDKRTKDRLEDYADLDEPVPASLGNITLQQCLIESVDVSDDAQTRAVKGSSVPAEEHDSALEVTIELRSVGRQPTTEEVAVVITAESEDGESESLANSSTDARKSLVHPDVQVEESGQRWAEETEPGYIVSLRSFNAELKQQIN